MISNPEIRLRPADKSDLDSINKLIASAIMAWDLPERVKRLTTPSYFYNELDLTHMQIMVAENDKQQIIGVAAWEDAKLEDLPESKSGLLLHGIFVAREQQKKGIGSKLFAYAEQAAKKENRDGLLVKAQNDAIDFFLSQGMSKLNVIDSDRDYKNRFWKSVTD